MNLKFINLNPNCKRSPGWTRYKTDLEIRSRGIAPPNPSKFKMVLRLYGSPISTCTRRVAMVLHEKQVPFKLHPIDLAKGEHKAPEFLARQPFGQVPYIVSDRAFTLISKF